MPTSTRKCRYCKERRRVEDMDIHNSAAFCKEGEHALKYARERSPQVRKRQAKKQKREFYENDIKTRREAAVKWFNRFIRLRDRGKPCISCGTTNPAIKYDAGHYIPAGSCSALRFDERNVHLQCSVNCNVHKSGNRVEYRRSLQKVYGEAVVNFLEGPQPTINITAEWYKSIEDKYKAKCRELEKQVA